MADRYDLINQHREMLRAMGEDGDPMSAALLVLTTELAEISDALAVITVNTAAPAPAQLPNRTGIAQKQETYTQTTNFPTPLPEGWRLSKSGKSISFMIAAGNDGIGSPAIWGIVNKGKQGQWSASIPPAEDGGEWVKIGRGWYGEIDDAMDAVEHYDPVTDAGDLPF